MPASLASDIMDQARKVYLNDAGASNFTNAVLLPILQEANKKLEKILLAVGYPGQMMKSSAITVAQGAKTLTLPADFLLPIRLYERQSGGTDSDWIPMREMNWEPENFVATTSMKYWAFRDNAINLPGASVDLEILLEYQRIIPVATSSSTAEENNSLVYGFLAIKTAEMAARTIGMNKTYADELLGECNADQLELERVIVLGNQGKRYRRQRFTTKRLASTNIG